MSSVKLFESATPVRPVFKVLALRMATGKQVGTVEFLQRTATDYDNDVQFIHATPSQPGASWYAFYEECCILIKTLGIDHVIAICDRTAAVSAALRVAHPHLKGPSFQSVYMTIDKSLSRDHVVPAAYNVPYYTLPLSKVKEGGLVDALRAGKIQLPVMVKPANGSNSVFVSRLSSKEDVQNYTSGETMANIQGMMAPVKQLLETFFDCEAYKCALTPKLLFEGYQDRLGTGTSVHTVDGLVVDGKLIPWAVTDNIYWTKHPNIFLGIGGPSHLHANTQSNAWKLLEELVENFKPYGFDNEFIDAEFFAYSDGSVKVMEINGRMFNSAKYLYSYLMDQGSPHRALVDMARGREVQSPRWLPNRYALMTYLTTFGTGRAGDHLDFEAVARYGEKHPVELRSFEDTDIKHMGDAAFTFGFIALMGHTLEDCISQMESMKHDLIKQPKYSPWFEESSE